MLSFSAVTIAATRLIKGVSHVIGGKSIEAFVQQAIELGRHAVGKAGPEEIARRAQRLCGS